MGFSFSLIDKSDHLLPNCQLIPFSFIHRVSWLYFGNREESEPFYLMFWRNQGTYNDFIKMETLHDE